MIFLDDPIGAKKPGDASPEHASTGSSSKSLLIDDIRNSLDVYRKEREYRAAGDTLRKLWSAVEQSTDMVIITDREGLTEYVNPAFEALTGYAREEVVGKSLRLLKSDQQPPEIFSEMWQTILAGNVFQGVIANRKKNGEVFFVEKSITPLRDPQSHITHFISNDRDITDRRRLEAQLSQTQKMDAIGRLAGGVAHDFNNLLLVISAYAELMQDALGAGHPLRRNVKEIMMAARRAADLTRQLLAFSRKQIQSLQLLDLNFVIRDICRVLPRLIGEDIQIAFEPGANLGKVKADPGQIEQVLMNLAVNGRDAMPRGGKLSIETSSVRLDETYVQRHSIVPAGDYVLLSISDTGQGIAPEHMPHIFEPFYTTKEEGKGTGLGLSTVYGIVKQNGGFIWVYSEMGLGTTIKVYLPRLQSSDSELAPLKSAGPAQRGYETLLLVEDEASVRQAAREFLTLNGYTVLEAQNGEDALRVSREYRGSVDLMISDVVMPEMGGARLAEQLAELRPGMKVLFVSGYAESTVQRHGAIDVTERFLQKPFSLKALASKIREVLESSKALAAAAPAG
jgi:PAS domain S-box-containing protein